MATLSVAISQAVTKSLLANLSGAAAQKFNVNETEFKEFLQGFLSTQLAKGKGARAPRLGADGKRLPGRVSGYLLFSNENRDGVKKSHPELKFTDIGKELGRMWSELSDSQKAEWNTKASATNAANGVTPTPAAAKTPAAKSAAAATTKVAAVSGSKQSAVAARAPQQKTVAAPAKSAAVAVKKAVPARKPVAKSAKHDSEDDE